MANRDEDLWAFALGVYAAPGIEAVCLELQDRFGADVVLVLFLVWLGLGGRRTAGEELEGYADLARGWQDGIIRPLREARRRLKAAAGHGVPAAYQSVKETELMLEREELRSLSDLSQAREFAFNAGAGGRQMAADNLEAYFALLAAPSGDGRAGKIAGPIIGAGEEYLAGATAGGRGD